jgi:hypothetical protein
MGVDEAASQAKVLHVARDHGPEELALIDVALTRPTYTGAMAIWDPSDVQKLVLAQADPLRPGLSNVAGYQTPIAGREDGGIVLEMGAGGVRQPAVLAPGLIAAFPVRSIRHIGLNQPVRLTAGAHGGTLALDGERTVVLAKRESVQVTLRRDGPWMLEPNKIFATLRHPVPE